MLLPWNINPSSHSNCPSRPVKGFYACVLCGLSTVIYYSNWHSSSTGQRLMSLCSFVFLYSTLLLLINSSLSLSLLMQLVPGLSIIIFSGSYWCKIGVLLIDSFKSCKETYCFKFRVRAKEGPVRSKETKLHLPECHSKPGMRLRVRKCTVKYRNI